VGFLDTKKIRIRTQQAKITITGKLWECFLSWGSVGGGGSTAFGKPEGKSYPKKWFRAGEVGLRVDGKNAKTNEYSGKPNPKTFVGKRTKDQDNRKQKGV